MVVFFSHYLNRVACNTLASLTNLGYGLELKKYTAIARSNSTDKGAFLEVNVTPKPSLIFIFAFLCILFLTLSASANFEKAPGSPPPSVVVSISPLSFLVSGVMEGVGQPHTLLPSGATPHSYNMRPSDARALNQADVIFWGGEALETFLARPLSTLPDAILQIELGETPGLIMEPDMQTQHQAPAEHGAANMHFWLSTTNAQLLVDEIAATLLKRDPDNKALYQSNAARMKQRLAVLKDELSIQLQDIQHRPYMVYHDAFRYFEEEFGLNSQGAIIINPDVPLGVASITKLRRTLSQLSIVCIFSEPQFNAQLLQTLTEGMQVRTESLDPLGAEIDPGPDGYFTLMRRLANSLHLCLSE